MKPETIAIHLNQLAGEVDKALNSERDLETCNQLHECLELLRAAWWALQPATDTRPEIVKKLSDAVWP